jgi:hypothetical protein
MKRHQIHIFTSQPGKTWASCSTCGRSSKQGTRVNAEAWMTKHQEEVLNNPKKQKRRSGRPSR